MSKHTPEPWRSSVALSGSENDRGFDIHADGKHIARVSPMIKNDRGDASEEGKANAQRAVACVNALAGLNPEAVPDVVAALRQCERELLQMRIEDAARWTPDYNEQLRHAESGPTIIKARAALAKLEDVG